MIHPIGHPLDPLAPYSPERPSRFALPISLILGLPVIVLFCLFVPIVLLVVAVTLIGQALLQFFYGNNSDVHTAADDPSDESPEARCRVGTDFDEETGWLKLKFNHAAFAGFIEALANVFFRDKTPLVIDHRGIRRMGKSGFHVHASDIFPPIEHDIIMSVDDGLFIVEGGEFLSASIETWQNAIAEWRRVLIRKQPALIVLDRYQAEWCSPNCKGRITFEYAPDDIAELDSDLCAQGRAVN